MIYIDQQRRDEMMLQIVKLSKNEGIVVERDAIQYKSDHTMQEGEFVRLQRQTINSG